jgi:ribosomal protein S18 acetylase RimI-like enzyme
MLLWAARPDAKPASRIMPADKVYYRTATEPDALCLSVLATHVFLDTYATEGIRPAVAREVRELLSEEAFAARLADPRHSIVVAEVAAHQVGFAHLVHGQTHELLPPGKRAAEVSRLYVQRPFLRKGIGKELLVRTEALAAARGSELLWLTAWAENASALRFYTAQGYRDVGGSVYLFEGDRYETRVFVKELHRRPGLAIA